jgi:hypothetical protein
MGGLIYGLRYFIEMVFNRNSSLDSSFHCRFLFLNVLVVKYAYFVCRSSFFKIKQNDDPALQLKK